MSDLKIFTDNIEPEALNQIYTLVKQPVFADCKVRIMPDVHAGAGCVIGFTADLGDKVIPNIVGVDIGCGMRTVELGQINIDFAALDSAIREHIPSGREVRKSEYVRFEMLDELRCYRHLKDIDRIKRSIGTLGGGNTSSENRHGRVRQQVPHYPHGKPQPRKAGSRVLSGSRRGDHVGQRPAVQAAGAVDCRVHGAGTKEGNRESYPGASPQVQPEPSRYSEGAVLPHRARIVKTICTT